ncbi:MAG: hypothetical protein FWE72_06735 [Spirochaetaceae bacterium]|nr:hypothetical protein [Spirochaetaceae bacterium]
MNKKIVIALFVLLSSIIIPQSNIFAGPWGETRLGLGLGMPNTVLIFRSGPYDIKVGYDFTDGKEYFFLNGSYMLINSRPFNSIFSGSLGLGLFGKVFFSEDKKDDNFMGGMNIPISAEVSFIDNFLQFFAMVAPGIELYPKPTFTTKSICWWVGFTLLLD